MAQRQTPIVGLDIDPVGITAVRASAGDRPAVAAAAVAPLEPGVVRDGEIADVEALAQALRSLFAANKGLGKRVRVGLANQRVVVRTIELPRIEDPKELAAAVRFQAQDAIPMPLDHAVLDWQALEVSETDAGPRQRVLLAAVRRDVVERVVAAIRAAGLRLEGIDLSAFAMIRALGPEAGEDQVVLYAQVAGITNVAVAHGAQCLFTRASGAGAEGLAVELAERQGLTLEHARGWLRHVGLVDPVSIVDGNAEIVAETRRVLEEGTRRIAAEIRQSLDFHHMQSDGASVSRVVLSGPALAIPGFADAVGAELGLPVAAGAPPSSVEGIAPGDLTIATGLALSGAPGVDLVPADERRAAGAAGRSGGAAYALLGALTIALLALTAAILASNTVADHRAQLADVTQQAIAAERERDALAPYTDFAALRERRLQTVRSLAESRFDWAHALAEVSRTIPDDVWLVSLDGSVTPADGGSGLRAAMPGPAIQVVGCTTSQARVATMMSAMRRIDGVERVSLSSSEKADAPSGGDGGGGGGSGNANDCRNGSDRYPQFDLTIFFAAMPLPATPSAAPSTAPASGAPAAGAGTTGPAGDGAAQGGAQ